MESLSDSTFSVTPSLLTEIEGDYFLEGCIHEGNRAIGIGDGQGESCQRYEIVPRMKAPMARPIVILFGFLLRLCL